jgi:hypothetical protein
MEMSSSFAVDCERVSASAPSRVWVVKARCYVQVSVLTIDTPAAIVLMGVS